jgi:amino-acid N-acetyltransferase
MRNGIQFEKAQAVDEEAIRELLRTSKLPYEDVHAHIGSFLIARSSGQFVGCVGLERAGRTALLRSLAVDAAFRGQGIGNTLCARVMEDARKDGLTDLYLLTTSEEYFFAKLGFVKQSRESAPPEIQATAQFTELCPASAILMKRSLQR